MYSHIIGMDEELWDVLEEGVGNLRLDDEGVALDRRAHTAEQKKLYKKHHLIRGILVAALPHKEYLKMSDKSTAKTMFTSLCANYEGNKKVREAKATMLVHQYELFRMKEDENIETMYSRFQTLVSGLQILKKSYVASDHVNKILRSLPAKSESMIKGSEPKVWKKTKQENFRQRTQKKFKTPWTNPRGPTKIWVPKKDIVDAAGVSKRSQTAEVLVPGQWLLATHDGRHVFVPNPDHERGRNCGIWRKPNWQDHWFWNDR